MTRRRTGSALFLAVLLLSVVISLTAGCKGSREGEGPADPGNANGEEDSFRGNTDPPAEDPSPVPGEEDEPDPEDLPDPPPEP